MELTKTDGLLSASGREQEQSAPAAQSSARASATKKSAAAKIAANRIRNDIMRPLQAT